MLKKVRKPLSLKTLAAYIIFGMICLTFVFVGLDGNQGFSTGGAAAVVNGSVISIADFREIVRRQEDQYRMLFKSLPPAKRREQSKIFRARILEDMIRNEVTSQSAEEVGLLISDSEVLDYIASEIPVFQEEDRFQPERYERFLKAKRYTAEFFEDKIRKFLISIKLKDSFIRALHVSRLESRRQSDLKDSKVKLKFISFDNSNIKENYKPQPQEMEDFLKNSSERIQQYYDTHGNEFMSEEQVKARHILIKAKSGDKKAEAKALEKVKALAERAKSEDFGKLALEWSEDSGSKEKKGDLGYFGRGKMVPEFEKVAFSAKLGELSEPVKTSYGYHIIKVEDRKPAEKQSLDSVKKQIAKKLVAEDSFSKVVDGLREKLKSQDNSEVDKFVNRYKFKWEDTGDFSIDHENIPKIGRGERIYEALFKPESIGPGNLIPELIESDGNYYIVKLLDMNVESEKVESEDESDFEEILRLSRRRGNEALNSWLDNWEETAYIRRNDKIVGN